MTWHEPRGPSIQSEPVIELNFAKASIDVSKERKWKPVPHRNPRISGCKEVPFADLFSSEVDEVYQSTQNLVLSQLAQSSAFTPLHDLKPKFEFTWINIPLVSINNQENEIPSLPSKWASLC